MNTLIKILCLIIIGFMAFFAEFFFKDILLFTLSWKQNSGWTDSLALIPALLIIQVLLRKYLQNKHTLFAATTLFYSLIFLIISPDLIWGINILAFFSFIYFLENISRNQSKYGALLYLLIAVIALVPLILYSFKADLTTREIYYIVLIKSCFLMRLISWVIDRRVYKRTGFDSYVEYMEFMFCPVFFIFPGQIQFFLYDYFHKSKTSEESRISFFKIVWLALWGLLLMVLYSKLDSLFWHRFSAIPFWMEQLGFFPVQLIIGFFWLILIYFQQTAGMAYQVSLARVIGYEFKYDMHWPLLARSPLDYLRRHSSYVRDYIVEMGLKPLALWGLRSGFHSAFVLPVVSVLSYACFISLQSGYRPDYNRSWQVTFVMILFLMIFIAIPYITSTFKKNHSTDTLLKEAHMKPLKAWRARDFLLWIGTLFILGCYKMFLGLAK